MGKEGNYRKYIGGSLCNSLQQNVIYWTEKTPNENELRVMVGNMYHYCYPADKLFEPRWKTNQDENEEFLKLARAAERDMREKQGINKYNIDDVLYTLRWDNKKTIVCDCLNCNGTGFLMTNLGEKRNCPECSGGKFYEFKKAFEVSEVTFEVVSIKKDDDDIYYTTYLHMDSDSDDWIKENDLFSTVEEAQLECDRRNEEVGITC